MGILLGTNNEFPTIHKFIYVYFRMTFKELQSICCDTKKDHKYYMTVVECINKASLCITRAANTD